jgi:predicted DNA-binding transcriptional regulator YafY
MGNVATRLLSLILLLQSRPNRKARELGQELGVSERTVYRYIGMLEDMGIPVYSERGPYGGFALVRGYRLPPLVFTAEEATVLYMGANLVRDVWGQTYQDAVTSVTAKLDNVLPDDLQQQVALDRQSLVIGELAARDYRPWESILHTLRQCIQEERRVRLCYRSFDREETTREVDPYALTFQWGLWYLVGFCHLRRDLRTFRVDRIQKSTALHSTFTLPKDFAVRDYLARSMRFEPNYTVRIWISAERAPQVRERHGHWMGVTENEDGSIIVAFGAAKLDWAVGWTLGYGADARAIEPQEMIARIRETARGTLQSHEQDGPPSG